MLLPSLMLVLLPPLSLLHSRIVSDLQTLTSIQNNLENPWLTHTYTVNKTKCHLKVLKQFLHMDEHRHIENIPPAEFDVYLSQFVERVRQTNGEQYEPSTLRGIISIIDS